jgi:hypothetical protein
MIQHNFPRPALRFSVHEPFGAPGHVCQLSTCVGQTYEFQIITLCRQKLIKIDRNVLTNLEMTRVWSAVLHVFRMKLSAILLKCCLLTAPLFPVGSTSYFFIRWINLLKPICYVMHQQFNIQQLYVLPTMYLLVCVLYLSENKQRLVPLTA